MLERPTLDELLLAVFGVAALLIVQLGLGSDGSPDAADTTPTADIGTAAATPAAATTAVGAGTAAATPADATPAADGSTSDAAPTREPEACDFRDELERVRGAVVRIIVPEGAFGASAGTGFHIGGGEYVTAAHVVQDDRGEVHSDILVQSAVTTASVPAEVARIGSFSGRSDSQQRDVAVLRAAPIQHALDYRTPTEDDVERDVRALGYPWSQAQDESARVPAPVVVRGVLSNTAVRDSIAIVQADVQAQSGMSGGPLVDECGVAIAVASAVPQALRGEAGDGLTVFISMAELRNVR